MANPFTAALGRAGRGFAQGFANATDPVGSELRRQNATSSAMLDALEPLVAKNPSIAARPGVQMLMELKRTNPQQAIQAMQNPELLKQLVTAPEAVKPRTTTIVASGDDDIGRMLNIPAGQRARVEVELDEQGRIVGPAGGVQAAFGESASGDPLDGLFGTGIEGRAISNLIRAQPADQQAALVDYFSKAIVGRPSISFDKLSGEQITNPGLQLPPSLVQASGSAAPGAVAPQVQPGAAPAAVAPPANPSPFAADIEDALSLLPGGATLFDQAGNLSGPEKALGRAAGSMPGLGALQQTDLIASERLANSLTEEVVDLLRTERNKDGRGDVEGERLRQRFGFTPEVLSNDETRREKAIQTRAELDRKELEIAARQGDGSVSLEQRKRDADALVRIRAIKDRISPSLVVPGRIEEFMKNNPSGTRFLIRDGANGFIELRVD